MIGDKLKEEPSDRSKIENNTGKTGTIATIHTEIPKTYAHKAVIENRSAKQILIAIRQNKASYLDTF